MFGLGIDLNVYLDDTMGGPPQMSAFSQNQVYQVNSYQQPAGILHGPGFKLVKAQTQVSKCSWYIKIVAWVIIVIGAFQALSSLINLFSDDDIEIEFDDAPIDDNDIELPSGPIEMANLLSVAAHILTVLIGYLILQTIKEPTRQTTWRLFKKTAFLMIIQFVLTLVIYICVFAAFGTAFDEWFQNESVRPGDYKIRHNRSGHEFKMNKPSHQPELTEEQEDDIETMQGIAAIVFMFLFVSFAITCCISTCFASCLLGGLYKFHTTAKELDIIQDLPSVRQVNMQQVPPHQVQPQMVALDGSNIVRGHVVMMPQVQNA